MLVFAGFRCEDAAVARATSPSLAEFVRSRRIELKLSIQDASLAAGLSDTKWRELEGGSERAREATLLKVARALDVPAERVLKLAEHEPQRKVARSGVKMPDDLTPEEAAEIQSKVDEVVRKREAG